MKNDKTITLGYKNITLSSLFLERVRSSLLVWERQGDGDWQKIAILTLIFFCFSAGGEGHWSLWALIGHSRNWSYLTVTAVGAYIWFYNANMFLVVNPSELLTPTHCCLPVYSAGTSCLRIPWLMAVEHFNHYVKRTSPRDEFDQHFVRKPLSR